ncbi:hypothetical protein C2857_007899 [Epichloe festucae Fl1]|uniref:Uncharacterized protein n=1 Tax=Epichloe festucae (strain Fl1) TaxID=877507 RepID=A0A7S9PV26_EPIFF|nr:hypothetical protein C2857_007899 [Epichloe festucae Fl1]
MQIVKILGFVALAAGVAQATAAPAPEVVDVVKLKDIEKRQHPVTPPPSPKDIEDDS